MTQVLSSSFRSVNRASTALFPTNRRQDYYILRRISTLMPSFETRVEGHARFRGNNIKDRTFSTIQSMQLALRTIYQALGLQTPDVSESLSAVFLPYYPRLRPRKAERDVPDHNQAG